MKKIRFLPRKYFVIVTVHTEVVLLPRQHLLVGKHKSINDFLTVFLVLHFLIKVEVEVVPFDRFIVVKLKPIFQLFFRGFHLRKQVYGYNFATIFRLQ